MQSGAVFRQTTNLAPKGDDCEQPKGRRMQHVSMAACCCNPVSSVLPLSEWRSLRVHPSEEAKVGECGSAKACQKWFQVGHARILRLDLSFAGDGISRPRPGLPWPTRPGFLSSAFSLPLSATF